MASVTLLGYTDGGLAGASAGELASLAADAASRSGAEGLLVFDDTGITGHPDHRAATGAAVLAGRQAGLPVLAWALPAAVAGLLAAETGQAFAGQPPGLLDVCVRVSRTRQRRAALLHASQISSAAVLWRRLQPQGECEHLRWLVPPAHQRIGDPAGFRGCHACRAGAEFAACRMMAPGRAIPAVPGPQPAGGAQARERKSLSS